MRQEYPPLAFLLPVEELLELEHQLVEDMDQEDLPLAASSHQFVREASDLLHPHFLLQELEDVPRELVGSTDSVHLLLGLPPELQPALVDQG